MISFSIPSSQELLAYDNSHDITQFSTSKPLNYCLEQNNAFTEHFSPFVRNCSADLMLSDNHLFLIMKRKLDNELRNFFVSWLLSLEKNFFEEYVEKLITHNDKFLNIGNNYVEKQFMIFFFM